MSIREAKEHSILMYTDENTGGLAAAGAEDAQLIDKFGSKWERPLHSPGGKAESRGSPPLRGGR